MGRFTPWFRHALVAVSVFVTGLAPVYPLGAAVAQAQSTPAFVPPDPDAPLLDLSDPDDAGALRDIKALRPKKPVRWPFILVAVLCGLLFLVGLYIWLRRRRKQRAKAEAARALLPPHEVALQALQALHRVNFADEAAVRQYYFAISEVLRAYVTARFALMASQLTTEEIFSRLPKLVELAPPENLRLRAFLAQTDQVKYALHQATPEEIGATFEQAVAFIEATTPKAAPQTPNAGGTR